MPSTRFTTHRRTAPISIRGARSSWILRNLGDAAHAVPSQVKPNFVITMLPPVRKHCRLTMNLPTLSELFTNSAANFTAPTGS